MLAHVKKMKLANISEAAEEIKYWSSKTIEEKIEAVEVLRKRLQKIEGDNGDFKGLRRVSRVTKLK